MSSCVSRPGHPSSEKFYICAQITIVMLCVLPRTHKTDCSKGLGKAFEIKLVINLVCLSKRDRFVIIPWPVILAIVRHLNIFNQSKKCIHNYFEMRGLLDVWYTCISLAIGYCSASPTCLHNLCHVICFHLCLWVGLYLQSIVFFLS